MSVLYIAPGTCAQAAHILVRELQLPIGIEKVPLRTPDSPIHRVNPLGRVPALHLDACVYDGPAPVDRFAPWRW
ncbi:Glutathione S-transferase GST-6.0 [compost metagenome]